jgi:hypothetical protein
MPYLTSPDRASFERRIQALEALHRPEPEWRRLSILLLYVWGAGIFAVAALSWAMFGAMPRYCGLLCWGTCGIMSVHHAVDYTIRTVRQRDPGPPFAEQEIL